MSKYFKLSFIIIVFVAIGFFLYSFINKLDYYNPKPVEVIINNSGSLDALDNKSEDKNLHETILEEVSSENYDKYDSLKKNFLYKGSIEDGDNYFAEDKLISALQKYLKAKKLNENDKNVDIKLGNVYFELHNYALAYKHYKGNDKIKGFSKEKEVLSLFYSFYDLSKSDILKVKGELEDLKLSEEEKVYYINSLQCAIDFSKCKQFYQDYFTIERITDIQFDKLNLLREGINAYNGSGLDDLDFKNALIIGKFFEAKHYAMVITLGNDLLANFPDYSPAILMVGKSYYEIGKYKLANSILKPYHEKNLDDSKLSYLLGVINLKLKLHFASNIYFNNALTNNYDPKIEVKRKLIYNYFITDNKVKMYSMFDDIFYDDNVAPSDFYLGIYQKMLDKNYIDAVDYIKRGINKFSKEATFYGYLADLYIKQDNFDLAMESIENGKSIDPKNQTVIFYGGLVYKEQGERTKALLSFKRILSLSKGGGDFVDAAQGEIILIKEEIEENKQKEKEALQKLQESLKK